MGNNNKPLGFYNYTVILTYIGMLSGFYGLTCCFRGHASSAVVALMVAGFCDMFDGAIASTKVRTDAEKCFGIQIDSLCDLICFGVLPGVMTYSLNPDSALTTAVAGLYILCALIRLAWFNVDEQERQKTSKGGREIYLGLPVTTSALFVPVFYSLLMIWNIVPGLPMTILLAVLGILFLTPFQLKKPHKVGKAAVVVCGVLALSLVIYSRGMIR
ncbi:MAG: CDP-alcohol phosphatidyltransferase family protein [Lachnospiraceae bacterium]|nr:CDP-alcohol phosphatidyltransferase family protein [Lachnospiraceae bacterium]